MGWKKQIEEVRGLLSSFLNYWTKYNLYQLNSISALAKLEGIHETNDAGVDNDVFGSDRFGEGDAC